MIFKKVNDKHIEKSEFAKTQGNPNKRFVVIYGEDGKGKERLELFKKYSTQKRMGKDEFGEDRNDLNYWVKPLKEFGPDEYEDVSTFDRVIAKLQEEDEAKARAKAPEKKEEKPQVHELTPEEIEENTLKVIPEKKGPGIKSLGAAGEYRVYAVTSEEGAQKFAVPKSRSDVRGWCITGGVPGHKWNSSMFGNYIKDILDHTFYIFEAEDIADSWTAYVYRDRYSSTPNLYFVAFTDNRTDQADNSKGYTTEIPAGLPYDKVPILKEYIKNNEEVEKVKNKADQNTRNTMNNPIQSDGVFKFRGDTVIGIENSEIEECTVYNRYSKISDNAFNRAFNLKKVTLLENLTYIGNNAFSGCLKLEEVTIKSSNIQLGNGVFDNCQSLKRINGKSFESIPSKTFHFCKSLTIIELAPNLRVIGKDAFLGCSELRSIVIPESCTSIGENAFFNCKNLVIRTSFTERPQGWYKNIENHVKAIEYAEKPVEVEEENQPTEDSKADIKILDVNPKEGESKEDFISRFMSETKEEYPDEKQRVAVAYSYWNKNKKKINDSEVYSLWELFHNNECAGWIIKMDDNPDLCVFSNSNNLGFLEEDEDSMSDRLVLEEKHEIAPNLYIYIGHSEEPDVFITKTFESDELATVAEAVEDIKKSWPQVKEHQYDSNPKNVILVKIDGEWKKWGGSNRDTFEEDSRYEELVEKYGEDNIKFVANENLTDINDDYYNGGIPNNAWEIFVNLYSTGDYQRNIPDNEKIRYCILPKQKAYWKTNQEDFYKSDISKSSMMLYNYPQETLEDVERVAQDIINKCGAKLVSENEYLALKNEDKVERASEIFANFEARKMNDSEIVIDTCQKDEEITTEEQEVKEIVSNFSIQALLKEAQDDLKTASDEEQLEIKYNNWLSKSDEWLNDGKITVSQQEEFEDELWDCYNELLG